MKERDCSQSRSKDLGYQRRNQWFRRRRNPNLRKSGYHELHLILRDFHEGVLTLRGRVSSFYLKQVARELIRRLDGAEEVNNRLEVAIPPCSP